MTIEVIDQGNSWKVTGIEDGMTLPDIARGVVAAANRLEPVDAYLLLHQLSTNTSRLIGLADLGYDFKDATLEDLEETLRIFNNIR